jgi:hypothetical protein
MVSSAANPVYPERTCSHHALRVEDVAATSAAPATWQRCLQIGSGHLLYGGFNHIFDYVLYPYAVYTLGMVAGGALMTLASLFQCALTLMLYERMAIDWVGGSLLMDLARKDKPTLADRAILSVAHRSKPLSFLTLCAFTDPFIVTAFFRRGAFNGLRERDWQLFFLAVVVCNLYWIVVADAIARGVAVLWHWLQAV